VGIFWRPGARFLTHRAGTTLFFLAGQAVLWVPTASGQVQRTVGFHLGLARSRQIWTGPISTETADGISLGVNVDVPTPAPFLSIRAELGYVGRSSVVWDEEFDPERLATANVRSHYLSIPIQGKFRFRFGPVSLYLVAGPTIDQLLETQCTQALCRVLSEERPTVLSVGAGSGVSVDFRDRFRGDLEGRVTQGLTDAYVANSSGIRYRSMEFLIRACIPF